METVQSKNVPLPSFINSLKALRDYLGAKWQDTVYFFSFFFDVIRRIILMYGERHLGKMVLLRQILYTGFEAWSIILLIAFAIGGLIVLEGNAIIAGFGQSKIFYTILVSVVTRELSCLITSFIIIARSGTAISTELGNMVISSEIEALLSFGISPISYLIVPRVLGVVISLTILSVYFNAAAILGGWIISNFFVPINFFDFLFFVFSELTFKDLLSGFIKAVSFGFIIALISSFEGLQVSYASTEVPQRTIKAVVRSLTWVIIFDILITALFYLS